MLTSGFFNSVGGDRKYDAEQLSSVFDGIINDGIFMSVGGQFMVAANTGMSVVVATGRAWLYHTWTNNNAPIVMTLDPSDALLNRIDVIALEVNHLPETRANTIKIIKGTPGTVPAAPALLDTNGVKQYPLAHIYVASLATVITQANITNKVGTTACPYVTGILSTIDITNLVAQWGSQWNNWLAETQQDTEDWTLAKRAEFLAWIATNEGDFTTWFNAMKGQLTTDAAGNLQTQINANAELEFNRYYGMEGKTTAITKPGGVTTIVETTSAAVATTTFTKVDNVTTITTNLVPTSGGYNYTKTVVITKNVNDTQIVESFTKTAK